MRTLCCLWLALISTSIATEASAERYRCFFDLTINLYGVSDDDTVLEYEHAAGSNSGFIYQSDNDVNGRVAKVHADENSITFIEIIEFTSISVTTISLTTFRVVASSHIVHAGAFMARQNYGQCEQL